MKNTILFFTFLSFLLFSCQNQSSDQNKQEHSIAADVDNKIYIEKGKKIAQASFKAMSEQLMKAMKEGGVSNALKYCNLEAMPLTDSLSKAYNVTIKRTALKLRNPANKSNTEEFNLLHQFKSDIELGKKVKPVIMKTGPNSKGFFAPIILKAPCMVCHGNISDDTKSLIAEHYPKDKAIGFKVGDLRGMWSIKFEDKK